MSTAYYYVTLTLGDKATELESSVSFTAATRYALELNIETGARAKVFYYSTLDNTSDFEVWPLDGLAGEYLR